VSRALKVMKDVSIIMCRDDDDGDKTMQEAKFFAA
jgi:hypothetical protein